MTVEQAPAKPAAEYVVKPVVVQLSAIVVGVLALQGAFSEHIQLLRKAVDDIKLPKSWNAPRPKFEFTEVRTVNELMGCDALIIPGGESTTISLVAERSGMLEPLRKFVKVHRKPVWGTCAGMILLAEQANRVKRGGQELIGGLDVRVDRNHFGRQVESFEKDINLDFLGLESPPFHAVFIRAPIVQKVLTTASAHNNENDVTVKAPYAVATEEVKVLGRLRNPYAPQEDKNMVAVMQGNCFGTSFHPELGTDARIHAWWLSKVVEEVRRKEIQGDGGDAQGEVVSI